MVEYMNKSDICLVCFGSSLDSKLIRHHLSYFPERIAFVHYECHKKIHETPLTQFIQYGEGDSKKFYDMDEHKNNGGSSIKSRLETQGVLKHE